MVFGIEAGLCKIKQMRTGTGYAALSTRVIDQGPEA